MLQTVFEESIQFLKTFGKFLESLQNLWKISETVQNGFKTGVTKQRKQGYFCTPIFFSETRKNLPEFFLQLRKQDICTSGFCSYKHRITITNSKYWSPARHGVSAYTQPQGFCWDDFGFLQIQLNGKKAKKKESTEKKTQRTEIKKKKEEKEKKFICCGWDSNQQLTRMAVQQNSCAANLSATVTYTQFRRWK